nr:DUF3347 domain-containing protein [uncultured Emticicia sp.]
MKNLKYSAIAIAFVFTAFKANTDKTSRINVSSITVQKTSIIDEIVSNYLVLKNALIKDDSKSAANAGKAIVAAMAKIDMKSLSASQMKGYMDIADDLKENAKHIEENAGKIAHQREHFVMLSKDVNDLLKTFGNSGPKLYQDFCPMANGGKGAIWISETKAIQNPYYGKAMMTCGSVKKEI